MNDPENKRTIGFLWAGLALLTCPCHLPILVVVLAGTTAGAFLAKYWMIAAVAFTGLFLLCVTQALRVFKKGER